MPVNILEELVTSSAPKTPLAAYYRARLECDAALDRKLRGEPARFKSGRHYLVMRDREFRCSTFGEVIFQAIRMLHGLRPDLVEQIAKRKKITRPYIARSPEELYRWSPGSRGCAREFAPGWYVDTHHGAHSIKGFLRDLFDMYGLKPEVDWVYSKLR